MIRDSQQHEIYSILKQDFQKTFYQAIKMNHYSEVQRWLNLKLDTFIKTLLLNQGKKAL